jgi:hypothetical protein
MNPPYDEPTFTGKPPKSVVEIRARLQSIQDASEPRPPGPYARGFPTHVFNPVQFICDVVQPLFETVSVATRNSDYYRRWLVRNSVFAGAFSGGLLGANIGYAMAIVGARIGLIPFSTILGLFVGSIVGGVLALAIVIRRRVDLFGPAPHRATVWNVARCLTFRSPVS